MELLRNTLSKEMWDQEVMGEVIGRTGLVYPEFDVSKHIRPYDYRKDWTAGVELYGCIDWGYAQAHGLLLVAYVGNDGRPCTIVVWDQPFDRTDDVKICEALINEAKKYPRLPRAVWTDPVGFNSNRTASRYFAQYGVSVLYENNPSKRRIIDTIEFVRRGLSNAKGEPCLWISAEAASKPQNGKGGKGLVPSFQNYSLGEADRQSGIVSNKPTDDNKHTHSLDALRYWYINMWKVGYVWPTNQFDTTPQRINRWG